MEDSGSNGVLVPVKEESTEQESRTRRQPPYHVILWNDDDHSYEYVIVMLLQLFGHQPSKGFQIAEEIHTNGRAVVLTTTMEHAELKRDQIHAFGKDDEVNMCQGAMSSTIEPSNR